jgi:flagellar biosynthesis/type III secretory pathway protein FliH
MSSPLQDNSMKYYRDMNNVVSTARQEGREEGIQAGLERGQKDLLKVIASQKFGFLTEDTENAIEALSVERLGSLGLELLSMVSLSELEEWLTITSNV